MISIEYFAEEKHLDAVDEYFPRAHATLNFDTEGYTLSNLMQGMIDIARFAGYRVDEEALTFVFDDLTKNF